MTVRDRYSTPSCIYCDKPGIKTNSDGKPLCMRHALGLPDPVSVPTQPGRNDPCKCGSGKKFKQCCLKK